VLVVACLLAAPLTILVDTIAPPLIVARVLNRLSTGDYQPNQLWASFPRRADQLRRGGRRGIRRHLAGGRLHPLAARGPGAAGHGAALLRAPDRAVADFHANNFGGSLVSQTNKLLGSYVRIQDTTVFQLVPLTCMVGSIVAIMSVQRRCSRSSWRCSRGLRGHRGFVSRPVRRIGAEHAATDSAQTGNLADAVSNVMASRPSRVSHTSVSGTPGPPTGPGVAAAAVQGAHPADACSAV